MDIAKISFEGEEADLTPTIIAQPAIFTLSVAAYTAALDYMPKPDAIAGHSLGEIAGLQIAGAYSLEDGFRIIKARAKAMDAKYGSGKGAMVAVLRKDIDTINEVCEQVEGLVVPVNLNLPDQTVISGEEKPVLEAAAKLAEMGARTVRLNVENGFHTKLMAPAADEFVKEIQRITLNKTQVPFYSNLTGGILLIDDYYEYFKQHMTSPVRFVEEVTAMTNDGIEKAIEFGPKKVVANLVKKNNKNFKVTNVEDIKGIESLKDF